METARVTSTPDTTGPVLTPDNARRVERARAVLAEPRAYDPLEMAGRIGRLEWHLQELLALVAGLEAAKAVPAR